MRFGFVTCVQLGLSCMEEIYASGGSLDLVLTLPDDRARSKSGRVYVDQFCTARGVPLRHIGNINDPDAVAAVRDARIDWLCIIGWSQIAKAELLAAPAVGCLGMHPTLLPIGRGRAAIPWAILKDLPETGVTLFKLTEGVDSGPILAQERVPLGPRETASSLYHKVEVAHRTLIRRVWPDLSQGLINPVAQVDSNATYWPGRTPDDGRLTAEMTVADADRLIRAVTRPYPGAFLDRGRERLRVWAAHPGTADAGGHRLPFADGELVLDEWDEELVPPNPPAP